MQKKMVSDFDSLLCNINRILYVHSMFYNPNYVSYMPNYKFLLESGYS